jgi:hypothetical protein
MVPMKHRQLALFFAIVTLSACGGRAVEQPGSGGSAPSEPGSEEPAPAAGRSSSPSPPSSSLPTHDLGDCTPGFSRTESPNRPCHWLTKAGSCFDEKEAACACICPLSGDSVCFSGFDDGPSSATLVQCL